MNLWRRIIPSVSMCKKIPQEINKKCFQVNSKEYLYTNVNITSNTANIHQINLNFNGIRYKSKKYQYDSDDDDNAQDEDSTLSKDSKVLKFSTTSMRADIILKSALGVSRNKIEQMFYESKIRVNGKKILKKSANIKLGDEVDVLKMVSPNNPDHIYVARVEILNIVPTEENINITARRFKNLLIENYDDNPHKSVATNDQE